MRLDKINKYFTCYVVCIKESCFKCAKTLQPLSMPICTIFFLYNLPQFLYSSPFKRISMTMLNLKCCNVGVCYWGMWLQMEMADCFSGGLQSCYRQSHFKLFNKIFTIFTQQGNRTKIMKIAKNRNAMENNCKTKW